MRLDDGLDKNRMNCYVQLELKWPDAKKESIKSEKKRKRPAAMSARSVKLVMRA